jgi:hypothetical protein
MKSTILSKLWHGGQNWLPSESDCLPELLIDLRHKSLAWKIYTQLFYAWEIVHTMGNSIHVCTTLMHAMHNIFHVCTTLMHTWEQLLITWATVAHAMKVMHEHFSWTLTGRQGDRETRRQCRRRQGYRKPVSPRPHYSLKAGALRPFVQWFVLNLNNLQFALNISYDKVSDIV